MCIDDVVHHICSATSPLSIVLVDETYMYDIPEDHEELKALVFQPIEQGFWQQFKRWQVTTAHAGVLPKAVEPVKSVLLATDEIRKQASGS